MTRVKVRYILYKKETFTYKINTDYVNYYLNNI